MRDPKGFLTLRRATPERDSVEARIRSWSEFYRPVPDHAVRTQAARCCNAVGPARRRRTPPRVRPPGGPGGAAMHARHGGDSSATADRPPGCGYSPRPDQTDPVRPAAPAGPPRSAIGGAEVRAPNARLRACEPVHEVGEQAHTRAEGRCSRTGCRAQRRCSARLSAGSSTHHRHSSTSSSRITGT